MLVLQPRVVAEVERDPQAMQEQAEVRLRFGVRLAQPDAQVAVFVKREEVLLRRPREGFLDVEPALRKRLADFRQPIDFAGDPGSQFGDAVPLGGR